MAERLPFQEQQYAFAGHIRNPDAAPAPQDIEDRRMGVYRELFYNNINGFLRDTFPVMREILDDEHWHAMVRDFFVKHRCHSPYFLDIPREFINYLNEEREPQPDDPAYLLELAHYEWVELALSIAESTDNQETPEATDNRLDGMAILSSLAWPLTYRFPVHRISAEFQPDQPGDTPTSLLVYRDREDDVHFLELNPVSARLFGLLSEALEHPRPITEILQQIVNELQHPNPDQVFAGGQQILTDWYERGILLGVRPV